MSRWISASTSTSVVHIKQPSADYI